MVRKSNPSPLNIFSTHLKPKYILSNSNYASIGKHKKNPSNKPYRQIQMVWSVIFRIEDRLVNQVTKLTSAVQMKSPS
jgi:hypothetical protein